MLIHILETDMLVTYLLERIGMGLERTPIHMFKKTFGKIKDFTRTEFVFKKE